MQKHKIRYVSGVSARDFFIVPTLRIEYGDFWEKYITFDWLWFYIGIRVDTE